MCEKYKKELGHVWAEEDRFCCIRGYWSAFSCSQFGHYVQCCHDFDLCA